MKTLLALSMLLVAGSVSAQVRAPGHYPAQFEITDVRSNCPKNAMCLIDGQIVTMTAVIGCMDEVVYKNFEVHMDGRNNVIHATSLVKRHPDSDRIRCIRANTVVEKITILNPGHVTLINSELE